MLGGINDDLIRREILSRLYMASDSSLSNVIFQLSTLRLVCKAWRDWVDRSPDWRVALELY
jgi:hypothetical protein